MLIDRAALLSFSVDDVFLSEDILDVFVDECADLTDLIESCFNGLLVNLQPFGDIDGVYNETIDVRSITAEKFGVLNFVNMTEKPELGVIDTFTLSVEALRIVNGTSILNFALEQSLYRELSVFYEFERRTDDDVVEVVYT